MKHEYTPGPWKVCHRRANVYRMETNEIHYGNDTECIAEYVADDNDARLIAAAPALVEALEGIINNAPSHGPLWIGGEEISNAIITLKLALEAK